MMRHLRLLGLVSIAVLALFAVPSTGVAQTPVQDQYAPAPDTTTGDNGTANTNDTANENTSGADNAGNAGTVAVEKADANGTLPFTGGSVPLVALLGLGLLSVGLVGAAATRKRRSTGSL
ncbi:MAG: hypothetical protein QOG15_1859 [Solirubrobacteraceae bacterium]|jgi:hypothetical protein|nr:hypothetical protein [Solirubrobacteraceae bacterium]